MTQTTNEIFDGANLSPRLERKSTDTNIIELPIGKSAGEGGVAVARAYKHAAGKSSTYAPQVVDMIYHMSRDGKFTDDHVRRFVRAKLAAERDLPQDPPPATFDQLVFLSANLTRLVIDPYRERCNSQVTIGGEREQPITLDWPIVLGGVDLSRMPQGLCEPWTKAAADNNLAVFAHHDWPSDPNAHRIISIDVDQPLPDLTGAAGVLLIASSAKTLIGPSVETAMAAAREATGNRIPIGIVAPAVAATAVVDATISFSPHFYVVDAQWTADAHPASVFPELGAAPALHALADTVEALRRHRREGLIDVIYHGGIRGGADAGKAICLGATAVCLGLSAVIGMGFKISRIADEADLLKQLAAKFDPENVASHVANFAKSVNMEVTMLARACGKSSVTNMEPEDLRALTIAVSAATGVPLTGKDYNYRTAMR